MEEKLEKRIERRLRKLDAYLVPEAHKVIALGALTLLFSLGIHSFSDLLFSLSCAAIVEWSYISCRKYGVLDTLIFIGVLPFLLLGATVSRLSKSSPKSSEPDFQAFATEVSDVLLRSINEAYDGKIIETHVTKDAVYITVETPYGLRVPVSKILAVVAKQLHISVAHIAHEDMSERRSRYTLPKIAADEYEAYKMRTRSMASFSEIWMRVLCKSTKHF